MSLINKFFDFKKKVNSKSTTSNQKMENEGIKMNFKGQRVNQSVEGPNINLSTFDTEFKEKGPPMLNMRTRLKVWGAMCMAGVYFYLTYKLIIFRLKADDLDLMEREVNEEYKLKKKINEINK